MDKFRVTMDSAIENAFLVHTPYGILKFERGPQNIYYTKPEAYFGRYTPSQGEQKEPVMGHFPQTVVDNV